MRMHIRGGQDCPCVHKVTQEMIDSLAIMDFKSLKAF